MKPFFLSILLAGALGVMAFGLQRTGWIVSHNNVQKLKTEAENEQKNLIRIKRSDLKKSGQLFVSYQEPTQKDWNRTLSVFDTRDNELLKHRGSILKVGNSQLNAWSNRLDTLRIFTMALPADPAAAAAVRVRRVHLATIVLQR